MHCRVGCELSFLPARGGWLGPGVLPVPAPHSCCPSLCSDSNTESCVVGHPVHHVSSLMTICLAPLTCATSASADVSVLTSAHLLSPYLKKQQPLVAILPGFPGRDDSKAALHPLPVMPGCTARVLAAHSQGDCFFATLAFPDEYVVGRLSGAGVGCRLSSQKCWGAMTAQSRRLQDLWLMV